MRLFQQAETKKNVKCEQLGKTFLQNLLKVAPLPYTCTLNFQRFLIRTSGLVISGFMFNTDILVFRNPQGVSVATVYLWARSWQGLQEITRPYLMLMGFPPLYS